MLNCCVLCHDFPLNNRWSQYGLVTVSQYQLCVRRLMYFLSFNVTGVYRVCVWSGHVLPMCVCLYHRTPAATTIGSDPLLGPRWVYESVFVCVRLCLWILSITDVPCLSVHLIRPWGSKNVLVSTHPHLGCYAAASYCYCKSASAKVNTSALSCLEDS